LVNWKKNFKKTHLMLEFYQFSIVHRVPVLNSLHWSSNGIVTLMNTPQCFGSIPSPAGQISRRTGRREAKRLLRQKKAVRKLHAFLTRQAQKRSVSTEKNPGGLRAKFSVIRRKSLLNRRLSLENFKLVLFYET
jgi:hypothetical protein